MAKARRRKGGRVSAGARQGTRGQQKRFMTYVLGAAATVAVLAAVVFAVSSNGGGGGGKAADFEFSLYQGANEIGFREGNLARLQGRPMVLNFWAGLCPPCRAEMPQFQLFYERFKDDVTLLGIDIGIFTGLGSRDDADALLRELGVTYPAGWTGDSRVPRRYGVTAMPTTVFISSDGTIFEKRAGAIDANFLSRVTLAMLADEAERGG